MAKMPLSAFLYEEKSTFVDSGARTNSKPVDAMNIAGVDVEKKFDELTCYIGQFTLINS